MPFDLVRDDATKIQCDAVVSIASSVPPFSMDEMEEGYEKEIFKAAGPNMLVGARKVIGVMEEGAVAVTPGFNMPANFIIHAVTPKFIDGNSGEKEKLRNCYRDSLWMAFVLDFKSIAIPLMSTGVKGYSLEEDMQIATEEINTFLAEHDMIVYLVLLKEKEAALHAG